MLAIIAVGFVLAVVVAGYFMFKDSNDWSSVYKQLLNDKQRLEQDFKVEYGNVNVIEVGEFSGCLIYDIDANGTPEFFVTYRYPTESGWKVRKTVVYSIVNGKLVTADQHFSDDRLFAEKKVPGVILCIWGEVYPRQLFYKNGVFTTLPEDYVSYPDGIGGNTIKVGDNIYAFNQGNWEYYWKLYDGDAGMANRSYEQNLFGNGKEFVYITGWEHKDFQSAYEAYTSSEQYAK